VSNPNVVRVTERWKSLDGHQGAHGEPATMAQFLRRT
jgi:hypothetical protein